MRYGDRLTFALLSLLFPFVDLSNQFRVDHIFPTAILLGGLVNVGITQWRSQFRNLKDGLAISRLGGPQNHKGAKLPAIRNVSGSDDPNGTASMLSTETDRFRLAFYGRRSSLARSCELLGTYG